jgi:glycine/serine hydroxymethyltransferase
MHIIAAKQLRLVKRYKMKFYVRFTITKNAKAMAEAFVKEVTISFQEVHNHMMLIDLRNKGFLEKKKMH